VKHLPIEWRGFHAVADVGPFWSIGYDSSYCCNFVNPERVTDRYQYEATGIMKLGITWGRY
jgi:hypothetical protein